MTPTRITKEFWESSNDPLAMTAALRAAGFDSDRLIRSAMCGLASEVLPLLERAVPSEARPRRAIETAEEFRSCKANHQQLERARAAAQAAVEEVDLTPDNWSVPIEIAKLAALTTTANETPAIYRDLKKAVEGALYVFSAGRGMPEHVAYKATADIIRQRITFDHIERNQPPLTPTFSPAACCNCGGSGGGATPMACPVCRGSGESRGEYECDYCGVVVSDTSDHECEAPDDEGNDE